MPALLTIAEAQQTVLEAVARLPVEEIPVEQALNRVLAGEINAAGDVPAFVCSAMDGYAVTAGPAGRSLPVTGESRAGLPFSGRAGEGVAIRISTGAVVPGGADAVIRQEDVEQIGSTVETLAEVGTGANIRRAGEDMRAGMPVLAAGTLLRAAELGAAVAAGRATVSVARRPRACVLCTGDELRAPGAPLGPGQIHNSNAPMVTALATGCGAMAAPARRLADDPRATEDSLRAAIESSDIVIVTGGISVGPHDHVKPALQRLGVEQQFWGVAMRPGKPVWFGTRDGTLVFGLPGNPVSAVVTFSLFARPALASLQGRAPTTELDEQAELADDLPQLPTREQAVLARLDRSGTSIVAKARPRQASHLVTALIGADALALIPAGEGVVPRGARVRLAELAR